MQKRKRVLVLCTGNSCRSQMAEAWITAERGDAWEARSAGTRPAESVHPLAVQVMAEAGVDIQSGTPQSVDDFLDENWDLVITVCDGAKESCPVFTGPVKTLHISFPDPAEAEGSLEEKARVFRAVRDSIREKLLAEIDRLCERNG